MESKGLRIALRIWVGLVLAFLFAPIVLIVLYSFNPSNIESWPIVGFTLHWYSVAFHDPQVRSAFLLSVRVAIFASGLALPGLVAGSIFTFSLTLGDYITPLLVGGTSSIFMGNIIYSNIGIANNVPFAAAMAMIPIAIMAVYLLAARALGAFEEI